MSVDRFGRFFSSPEALEITGLSNRRLHYWVDQGYLQSERKQPTGSGNPWSFPYIDILKLYLAKELADYGLELPQTFNAVTTLTSNGLPFTGSYLATTANKGWTITNTIEPDPTQLLHIVINLEAAIEQLDTQITELNQQTLPL